MAAGTGPAAVPLWTEGADEAAYIAFHPAYSLPGIDPETFYDQLDAARGWSRHDHDDAIRRIFDHVPPHSGAPLYILKQWFNNTAKREARLVGWHEMRSAIGVESILEFWRILSRAVVSGPPDYAAERLDAYARECSLFLPSHQELQPALERVTGQIFRNAGCDTLQCTDLLEDYSFEVTINDLVDGPSMSNDLPKPYSYAPTTLWCDKVSIGCHADWDSLITVFRGQIDAMKKSRVDELLEGRWASSNDEMLAYFSWPSGVRIWADVPSLR